MQMFAIFVLSYQIAWISGHARLLSPPARSSAWRENPNIFPKYYDDNQMNCGGYSVQWFLNDGKCGICGEQYDRIRHFEKGGDLYRGNKVRTYRPGQLISVTVEITANHLGYYEFRLCNVDAMTGDATQSCLDRTPLKDNNGNTRIPVLSGQFGKLTYQIQLPKNMVCKNCLFQWKYNTQNSWGVDTKTGKGCVGCGPQEQFYGCADISILNSTRLEELRLEKLKKIENSTSLA